MIEINIDIIGEGSAPGRVMMFVTDYTLPTGERIVKDINNQEDVGFSALIPYEGQQAKVNYSDGTTKTVRISDITEDYLKISG